MLYLKKIDSQFLPSILLFQSSLSSKYGLKPDRFIFGVDFKDDSMAFVEKT